MENKHIQIRSFVKGGNHGQYYQALGLREVLKSILPDSNVSHLNYNNHVLKEIKAQVRGFYFPKYLMFRFFWKNNLCFTKFNDQPDVSVYGSDMIWNQESKLFPPDKVFFGYNDSAPKIAYAPSVGFRGSNEPSWISNSLSQFSHIGVRDYKTAEFVYDHIGIKPPCVADPCFYLAQSNYIKKNIKRKNCISIYSTMHKKIYDAFKHIFPVQDREANFDSYNFYGYFPRSSFLKNVYKQLTNPFWTINKIAESKLLLTNTFHGVIVALMTKTPFIAFVTNPNLSARLDSPIKEVFGNFRIINIHEISLINEKNVEKYIVNEDFDYVNLDKYIDESKNWLSNAIFNNL